MSRVNGIGCGLDDDTEMGRYEIAERLGIAHASVFEAEKNALRKLRWAPGTRVKLRGRSQAAGLRK